MLYALIAAFFAWRLFNTLGTRHENERTRPNPFTSSNEPPAKQKELLALPLELPKPKAATPLLAAFVPAPQSLHGAIYAVQEADKTFDERSFVKGARMAFEMIVHAFAASEREALKPLVSPVLFEAFKGAIDAREAAKERVEMKLLNVTYAHITAAEMKDRMVYITVEFTSDQARAHYQNDVLKEDEKPTRLHDIWTFRRELNSTDPNWILVETRSV